MKVLKTVAIVVGAVALVATGIGVAMGGLAAAGAAAGATASTFLGMTAATWMTIGTIAGIAGGVLSLGTALLASRPSFTGQGNPLNFQTNPQSGLPYAIGRTRMSGLKIDGRTSSSKTDGTQNLLWLAALLSCTPAHAVEQFKIDNQVVTFDGSGGATGSFSGWMAQKVALGAMPQTSPIALSFDGRSFPSHSSSTKLSGMAHTEWALKYDPDGKVFPSGLPDPAWIGKWRKCYDPRKDSTYPGGSGAHRAGNEATYEWTRNPIIHALNWAMGHAANGKLVCGIGAPIETIRVADFAGAANVADANGWGCGGVEYTTDSKWDIFKRMLAAGGAIPTKAGAMIGCMIKTPRVSVGTIDQADFLDELTYTATKPRRERFNTVLPRYVSEAHDWQIITGGEVSVPAYVTADGGKRTKGIDFPLVQAEVGQAGYDGDKQAGQLAAYEIVDSREASIECVVKPRWIGLRVGDCVVLNKPDDGIVNQKVILTSVALDPARGVLNLIASTETDSKHAFALGQTTTPPPAPTLSVPAGRPDVPGPSAWGVAAISMADGQPGIRISGSIDDPIADRVLVQYRRNGTANWISASDIAGTGTRWLDIGPLDSLTGWDVRLAYVAGPQVGDWLEILNTATGASAITRLNPRGDYDAGATYDPGDAVVWTVASGGDGNSYKRIGTGSTTNVPPSDAGKWVLLAIRGEDGIPGSVPTLIADNTGGGTIIIEGDSVRKTGTAGWNASAYSQESYGTFYARAVVGGGPGPGAILGVSASPPQSFPTHGIKTDNAANCYVVHNDVVVFSLPAGSWPAGTVLEMVGDGRSIKYYVDGALKYTGTTNVAGPWSLSCSVFSTTSYKLTGLRFSPSGAAGADAIAFVQEGTPGAPSSVNQLWLKPSTKQIFRWDGSAWVDTLGQLSRYDEIIAEYFKPDEGVDIGALVPGTQRAAGSGSASGSLASVGASLGTRVDSAVVPILSVNLSTAHLIRCKLTGSAFGGGNTALGHTAPSAGIGLYVKIGAGAWTAVSGMSASTSLPTTAAINMSKQNIDFGEEIQSAWSGAAQFGVRGYVIGGEDAGATLNNLSAQLEIIGAK